MLEVLGMKLTEADVRMVNEGVPAELKVNLSIDNITKHDEFNVVLSYTYVVNYLPDMAVVTVRGIAFCRDTKENISTLLEAWRKKREIPENLGGAAVNMINANTAVNTLFLIRPFNLVPHFMPPPVYVEGPPPKGAGPKAKAKAKPKKKKR